MMPILQEQKFSKFFEAFIQEKISLEEDPLENPLEIQDPQEKISPKVSNQRKIFEMLKEFLFFPGYTISKTSFKKENLLK